MSFFSDKKSDRALTDIKDTSLDNEASSPRVKIPFGIATDFFCFRCNIPKKAKKSYEWYTSEGTKIVCNGCNGFLCSKSKITNPDNKRGNRRAAKQKKKGFKQTEKISEG